MNSDQESQKTPRKSQGQLSKRKSQQHLEHVEAQHSKGKKSLNKSKSKDLDEHTDHEDAPSQVLSGFTFFSNEYVPKVKANEGLSHRQA